MKRFFTNLVCCAVAAFALLGVACTPEPEDKLPTPNFPAAVNTEVAAGEIYTLTIEPNQAWKLSIPEDATYFTILDNENEVYSIGGEAGTYEVQIKVADIRDYNENHTCEVSLSMGRTKRIIATLTLGKLTRTIELYDVILEDNEWTYGDETQFAYSAEQIGEQGITLNWGENGLSMFTHRIKVVSNFTWKIDGAPAWIQAISNNDEDITELWIKGNGANYPTEASTATLSFLDASDSSVAAVATLKVSIPAATSVFSFNDFEAETKFNAAGEIYNAMSGAYYEGNAEGSVTFTNDEWLVYTLSFEPFGIAEGAYMPIINEHEWINCTIAEWNSTEKDILQERNVTISVDKNNDADREAMVILVPKSVATAEFKDAEFPEEMLEVAAGGMGASGKLVAKFEKYLLTTVKQAAHPGPITLTNATDVSSTIQLLKVSTSGDNDISYDYPDAQHGYELLYTSKYDNDDAMFKFDGKYTSVEFTYFDNASGSLKVMTEAESWIKVTPFGTDGGFRLTMNPTETTNKHWNSEKYYNGAFWSYVVFKNEDDIVAVISALHNFNYSLTGESSGSTGISFSYPQYATDPNMDGSSLEQLTSGAVWQKIVGDYGDIPVWHLTYTKSPATMSGLSGINTEWVPSYMDEADKSWLSFEGGEMATVSMAKEGNGKTGVLIFKDSNMVPKMALVCSLKLAQQ